MTDSAKHELGEIVERYTVVFWIGNRTTVLDPVQARIFDHVPIGEGATAEDIAAVAGVSVRDAARDLASMAANGFVVHGRAGYLRRFATVALTGGYNDFEQIRDAIAIPRGVDSARIRVHSLVRIA